MALAELPEFVGRRTRFEDEGAPLYVTRSIDITSQCSKDVRSRGIMVRLDYTGTLLDTVAIVVVTERGSMHSNETAFAFERLKPHDEKLVEIARMIGIPPYDLLQLMQKQANR